MTRLLKFRRLSAVERRLFLQAAWWLVAMRLGLWLLPFARLLGRTASPQRSDRPGAQADQTLAEKIGWAVTTAATYVPGGTCLIQALAARAMLRGRGLPAEMQIGVAKDGAGRLQAHAWIACHGKVIVGSADHENYLPLSGLTEPRFQRPRP